MSLKKYLIGTGLLPLLSPLLFREIWGRQICQKTYNILTPTLKTNYFFTTLKSPFVVGNRKNIFHCNVVGGLHRTSGS